MNRLQPFPPMCRRWGCPPAWLATLVVTFCSCQTATHSTAIARRTAPGIQPGVAEGPASAASTDPATTVAHSGPQRLDHSRVASRRVTDAPTSGIRRESAGTAVRPRLSTPFPPAPAGTAAVVPAGFAGPPCPTCPPGMAGLPAEAFGPTHGLCAPPAGDVPSPEEYVCNGGDRETSVFVKRDWGVEGLHPGDTVAHFDTLDGQTRVVASNEVCLYAPRFAAVRKVYGPIMSEQLDRAVGVELPLAIGQQGDVGEPTTVSQPLQPGRKHRIMTAQQFRERARDVGIENAQLPATAQDHFLPFEDLLLIRRGTFDNTEKPRLAQRLQAAVTWTSDQGPQVLLDHKAAVQAVGVNGLQSIYTYELPPGKSRLRICKIASRDDARSGEIVDFTLRFDNVGDQVIGNVTVLDRLHDRLELVPDSQRCTLPAQFSTEDDDGSPRVLRWELAEPLPVGEGGIIRFQCRVR